MGRKRSRPTSGRERASKRKQRTTAEEETQTTLLPELVASVLWLWGSNCFGQLGLGEDIMEKTRPTLSNLPQKILDVAAGGMHTVVLLEDGTLQSFGVNDDGALGRLTSDSGAVEEDPTLPGVVQLPTEAAKPTQVVCTDSGSFVLTDDGCIFGWGTFRNDRGIFGFSPTVLKQTEPVCVYRPNAKQAPAVKLSAGGNHIIAILKNGGVLSWGDGTQGQLGRLGLRNSRREQVVKKSMLTPAKIEGYRGVQFVDAFCGEFGTFLKTSKSQFYAFGLNNSGQLAIDLSEDVSNEATTTLEGRVEKKVTFLTPTSVESFKRHRISQVAAGKDHGIGVDVHGQLYSWGVPTYGVLGREDVIDQVQESTPIPMPAKVTGVEKEIKSIGSGQVVSGCIDVDGDVYTWGAALNEMLGVNTEDDVLTPQKIPRNQSMRHKNFRKLAFGGQHTVLLGI